MSLVSIVSQTMKIMTKTCFALLINHCKRRGTKHNKLTVGSLLLLSYTGVQTKRYLRNPWIFQYGLWYKKCFLPFNRCLWWTGRPTWVWEKKNCLRNNPSNSVMAWSGRAELSFIITNIDCVVKKNIFVT